MASLSQQPVPLVVHIIYRLDFGGLETLLVECINRMPHDKYRHAIVCLTGYTDFARTIQNPQVQLFALDKQPGLGLSIHFKLWKLLRKLQPKILHTYNISTVEYAFTATLAGVPVRVHAEHGRDASDPQGRNRKHNYLRRALVPLIDCFVPVSQDLRDWLGKLIKVPGEKNLLIHNGVDTDKFRPPANGEVAERILPFKGKFVIGTVGRIQDVKNHAGLINAFVRLRELLPDRRDDIRLVIVGDGPLLPTIRQKVLDNGLTDLVWLPGSRTDIADLMRAYSIFVLPSLAEGTPVTILEAMASGLPVVATRVGGVPEVVVNDQTGLLVPPSDTEALAQAMALYAQRPTLVRLHGDAGRELVEQRSSVTAMVKGYMQLYEQLCDRKSPTRKLTEPCAE